MDPVYVARVDGIMQRYREALKKCTGYQKVVFLEHKSPEDADESGLEKDVEHTHARVCEPVAAGYPRCPTETDVSGVVGVPIQKAG
jgi:hypothetical protein